MRRGALEIEIHIWEAGDDCHDAERLAFGYPTDCRLRTNNSCTLPVLRCTEVSQQTVGLDHSLPMRSTPASFQVRSGPKVYFAGKRQTKTVARLAARFAFASFDVERRGKPSY